MSEDKASVWKLDLTVQKGIGGFFMGDKDEKVFSRSPCGSPLFFSKSLPAGVGSGVESA